MNGAALHESLANDTFQPAALDWQGFLEEEQE